MVDMARFVKPILSMVPPDPLSFDVPGLRAASAAMGRRFQRLSPHATSTTSSSS